MYTAKKTSALTWSQIDSKHDLTCGSFLREYRKAFPASALIILVVPDTVQRGTLFQVVVSVRNRREYMHTIPSCLNTPICQCYELSMMIMNCLPEHDPAAHHKYNLIIPWNLLLCHRILCFHCFFCDSQIPPAFYRQKRPPAEGGNFTEEACKSTLHILEFPACTAWEAIL